MEEEYGFEVPQLRWYDERNNPYVQGFEQPSNLVEKDSQPLSQGFVPVPTFDFDSLETTNNRPINSDYLNYIYRKLHDHGYDDRRAAVLLGQIAEESGGDPFAVDATGIYQGLLQWAPDRYQINTFNDDDPYREINRQLKYFFNTVDDLDDKVSWTHGGEGSGYGSRKDAYADWQNTEDMGRMNHGLSFGYVRPTGKARSAQNRLSVGSQIYNLLSKPPQNTFAEGGDMEDEVPDAWNAYQEGWHEVATDPIASIQDPIVDSTTPTVEPMQRVPIAQARESTGTRLLQNTLLSEFPQFSVSADDMTYNEQRRKGGYSVLDSSSQEAIKRSNSILAAQEDAAIKQRVSELSSGEGLKALQQTLVNQGYYGSLKRLGKLEIKRIQRQLVDAGYLSDAKRHSGEYKEVDGIVGPKTTAAYTKYLSDREVDGRIGPKTRAAATAYFANQQNRNPYKDKIRQGVDGCARFVRQTFEDRFGDSQIGGLSGQDAWTMPDSILRHGGQLLYNIYDSGTFNNRMSTDTLASESKRLTKDNPIDLSTLSEGDVVGMYVPGSHAMAQAIKKGSTFNTHVGIVVGKDTDGMPLVADNIHKHGRVQRADRLGNFRITIAVRPKQQEMAKDASQYMQPKESTLRLPEGKGNEIMASYMNGVEGAKDFLSQIFPYADADSAALLAGAVQKRETNYMTRRQSDVTGKDKIMAEARRLANRGKNAAVVSTNNGKLKLSSFSESERRLLGIRGVGDLEKPEVAGKAAMYLMMKYSDYFHKLAATYPSLEMTEDDINALVAMSFNQGAAKLMSQGFDAKTGEYKHSEMEALRALEPADARIKDVSSTNYAHIPVVGNLLYNILESGHQPYASSALQHMHDFEKTH